MASQQPLSKRITRHLPKASTYIGLSLGAFVMVLPFIWMLLTSVKVDSEIFSDTLKWFPSQFDFRNYSDAYQQTNMGRLFANTLFVTTVSVA